MEGFERIEFNESASRPPFGVQFLMKPTDQRWKSFPASGMAQDFFDVMGKVKNFKMYEDDILLAGCPRSGTTLVSEMIWLIANNFDFEKAKKLYNVDRIPGLEMHQHVQMLQIGNSTNPFENMPRPRTFKTHFPVQFLPDEVWTKKPKLVYISRDLKDVAVSMFHLSSHYNRAEMNQFFDDFMSDYALMGPHREHRLNYWNIPDYSNILYLTYESVTSNMEETIAKVANFIGVEVSKENLSGLKEYLNFDNMKSNDACNGKTYLKQVNEWARQKTSADDFIRRGKIGGFKDEMPAEYVEKFNKWIAEEDKLLPGFPIKKSN